jgi:hypothetical protein
MRKTLLLFVTVCFLGLFLTACAGRHRNPGGVIVDMRGVDPVQYQKDLDECKTYETQVDAEGKVSPRPVKIGTAQGGDWVILDGVKPGEMVMVDGFQKLRGAAPVKPVPWQPAGSASAASAASAAVSTAAAASTPR